MPKDFLETKKGVEILKTFIRDEQWESTLKFDMGHSEEIFDYIINIISFFNSKPTVEEVEKIIIKVNNKSLDKIFLVKKENDPYKKYKYIREAYAYYGLIEVITEGSIYSENTAEQLKDMYGDKYLEILSMIDRMNPSELTNFSHTNIDIYIDYDNEVIKKYLMLKRWQDKQNLYHENVIYPVFSSYRDEFEEFFNNILSLEGIGTREKLVLYELSREKIIDIDEIASFILCGLEEELAYIIGGKAYGLAILYSNDILIPKTYVVPINTDLKENDIVLDESKRYAVRSSADVEDNKENSFAGQFDSFLDVSSDDIYEHYKKVLDSVNNERLKAYIKRFNLKEPNMAVIIEEFKSPDISGVWMGKSQDEGILEWTLGTGDKLVSGYVKPKTEIWNSKVNIGDYLKIDNEFIGNIMIAYQQKIGNICDFEWCIVDNKLYMLQYRPVTKIINNIDDGLQEEGITGIPASSGITVGKGIYIEDIDEKEKWQSGAILITECTDPDWTSIMVNASGIVTSQGGFLCHAAIIARELGIPCVTGIGDSIDDLKGEYQLELDGNKGMVKKCN